MHVLSRIDSELKGSHALNLVHRNRLRSPFGSLWDLSRDPLGGVVAPVGKLEKLLDRPRAAKIIILGDELQPIPRSKRQSSPPKSNTTWPTQRQEPQVIPTRCGPYFQRNYTPEPLQLRRTLACITKIIASAAAIDEPILV